MPKVGKSWPRADATRTFGEHDIISFKDDSSR